MGIVKEEYIGNQRLILGDCLAVMPTLGRFDAVVTDVPYGISQKSNGLRRLDYGDWDGADATCVALSALALCRSVPSVIAWCGWHQFQAIAESLPGRSTRPLTWAKPNPPVLNGQSLFLSATEHAFYGKLPAAWFVGGCVKSYWVGLAPQEREHPTQKPVWLMEACVSATVPPGGTCLDMFMGSGTTLVACQRMGRHGTGIEIDKDYWEIACRRVDEAARQPDLLIQETRQAPVQEQLL